MLRTESRPYKCEDGERFICVFFLGGFYFRAQAPVCYDEKAQRSPFPSQCFEEYIHRAIPVI